MRILQINSAKNIAHDQKHIVDLTRGLINGGHELFLAVAPDSMILEKLAEFPEKKILPVKIKNAFDVFAVRKIVKFVKQNKIEIVHAHADKDYLTASFACRFAPSAKFILTRHVLFPIKNVQKFVLKNVAKVIAVSSAIEANLEKTFSKEKIVTIPNGIDVENRVNIDKEGLRKEFRFENNISFDAMVLGTIGELKHHKGQQDFVLAAQIIAKQFPETHFISVGKDNSYDKSFRRELKRLVKTFDLEKHFSWFDWIEDTKPLFSSLDIFVSPSHSESFGAAILEAMASGCAVVSTETEGAKELIENEKTGILTPIKNPVKLAETICRLLENKVKLEELGKNAKNHAKENFGLKRMISETEKVYREII